VTTTPRLRTLQGGFWRELPPGAGTVLLSVSASDTQRVRFVLTPTGTDVARYAKLPGQDRTPADGFTLTWHYPATGSWRTWTSTPSARAAPPPRHSASPTDRPNRPAPPACGAGRCGGPATDS